MSYLHVQTPTPHNGIMLALSNCAYRTTWYEYHENMDKVVCNLCGRAFTENRGPQQSETWNAILAHEARHIAILDAEKVAAAETLYQLRSEEVATRVTGLIQNIRTEYSLGSYTPHMEPDGAPVPQFNMPKPTWEQIIEEVWGCIPDVTFPTTTTEGPQL